ncbi:myb-like protein X [Cylas formicarius]|uniref:myb-like protein X n=1 Tax=Cylas formicarius TaxID=197179 RepID=UPI002958A11E|nr:myb-like protein X [Cylas formicarius]XP_060522697.1 myb-like protein X [Cylas formicarius]
MQEKIVSWYCRNLWEEPREEHDHQWVRISLLATQVKKIKVLRSLRSDNVPLEIQLNGSCLCNNIHVQRFLDSASGTLKLIFNASDKDSINKMILNVLPNVFKNQFSHTSERISKKKPAYKQLKIKVSQLKKSISSDATVSSSSTWYQLTPSPWSRLITSPNNSTGALDQPRSKRSGSTASKSSEKTDERGAENAEDVKISQRDKDKEKVTHSWWSRLIMSPDNSTVALNQLRSNHSDSTASKLSERTGRATVEDELENAKISYGLNQGNVTQEMEFNQSEILSSTPVKVSYFIDTYRENDHFTDAKDDSKEEFETAQAFFESEGDARGASTVASKIHIQSNIVIKPSDAVKSVMEVEEIGDANLDGNERDTLIKQQSVKDGAENKGVGQLLDNMNVTSAVDKESLVQNIVKPNPTKLIGKTVASSTSPGSSINDEIVPEECTNEPVQEQFNREREDKSDSETRKRAGDVVAITSEINETADSSVELHSRIGKISHFQQGEQNNTTKQPSKQKSIRIKSAQTEIPYITRKVKKALSELHLDPSQLSEDVFNIKKPAAPDHTIPENNLDLGVNVNVEEGNLLITAQLIEPESENMKSLEVELLRNFKRTPEDNCKSATVSTSASVKSVVHLHNNNVNSSPEVALESEMIGNENTIAKQRPGSVEDIFEQITQEVKLHPTEEKERKLITTPELCEILESGSKELLNSQTEQKNISQVRICPDQEDVQNIETKKKQQSKAINKKNSSNKDSIREAKEDRKIEVVKGIIHAEPSTLIGKSGFAEVPKNIRKKQKSKAEVLKIETKPKQQSKAYNNSENNSNVSSVVEAKEAKDIENVEDTIDAEPNNLREKGDSADLPVTDVRKKHVKTIRKQQNSIDQASISPEKDEMLQKSKTYIISKYNSNDNIAEEGEGVKNTEIVEVMIHAEPSSLMEKKGSADVPVTGVRKKMKKNISKKQTNSGQASISSEKEGVLKIETKQKKKSKTYINSETDSHDNIAEEGEGVKNTEVVEVMIHADPSSLIEKRGSADVPVTGIRKKNICKKQTNSSQARVSLEKVEVLKIETNQKHQSKAYNNSSNNSSDNSAEEGEGVKNTEVVEVMIHVEPSRLIEKRGSADVPVTGVQRKLTKNISKKQTNSGQASISSEKEDVLKIETKQKQKSKTYTDSKNNSNDNDVGAAERAKKNEVVEVMTHAQPSTLIEKRVFANVPVTGVQKKHTEDIRKEPEYYELFREEFERLREQRANIGQEFRKLEEHPHAAANVCSSTACAAEKFADLSKSTLHESIYKTVSEEFEELSKSKPGRGKEHRSVMANRKFRQLYNPNDPKMLETLEESVRNNEYNTTQMPRLFTPERSLRHIKKPSKESRRSKPVKKARGPSRSKANRKGKNKRSGFSKNRFLDKMFEDMDIIVRGGCRSPDSSSNDLPKYPRFTNNVTPPESFFPDMEIEGPIPTFLEKSSSRINMLQHHAVPATKRKSEENLDKASKKMKFFGEINDNARPAVSTEPIAREPCADEESLQNTKSVLNMLGVLINLLLGLPLDPDGNQRLQKMRDLCHN